MGLLSMLAQLITAAAVFFGYNSPNEANLIPTVNLSAIRYIACDKWTGSGYMIAKNTIVTDNHVATGTSCVDVKTGHPLKRYKVDDKHDLALMTGDLPEMPYIKYSCDPLHKGQTYMAYGISGYHSDYNLFRQVKTVFTGRRENVDYGEDIVPGAVMEGASVPGMSGGPVIDEDGYAHGQVEGGIHDFLGFPTKTGYVTELHDTILCK